ncbi:MAG: hypothetical protein ACOC9T_00630 [Myxococcota bacterium]
MSALEPWDPAETYGDPVAARVLWTPLQRVTGSFDSHRLVKASPSRMELRPGLGGRIFVLLIAGSFIGVPAFMAAASGRSTFVIGWAVAFSLPALLLLSVMFARRGATHAFDLHHGRASVHGTDLPLSDIRAIQLIRGVSGFELNLVRCDGERVPMARYVREADARKTAQAVAQFVSWPVWTGSRLAGPAVGDRTGRGRRRPSVPAAPDGPRESAKADLSARFGDPLASRVQWTHAAGSSANFETHRIRSDAEGRLVIERTAGARLFGWAIAGMGAGCLLVSWTAGVSVGNRGPWLVAILVLSLGTAVGGVFVLMGHWLLRSPKQPCVIVPRTGEIAFDARASKGRPARYQFRDVHALQVVPHRREEYVAYEVNLVLHDGSRAHLIPASTANRAQQLAAQLAETIGVPVWDASDLDEAS